MEFLKKESLRFYGLCVYITSKKIKGGKTSDKTVQDIRKN